MFRIVVIRISNRNEKTERTSIMLLLINKQIKVAINKPFVAENWLPVFNLSCLLYIKKFLVDKGI